VDLDAEVAEVPARTSCSLPAGTTRCSPTHPWQCWKPRPPTGTTRSSNRSSPTSRPARWPTNPPGCSAPTPPGWSVRPCLQPHPRGRGDRLDRPRTGPHGHDPRSTDQRAGAGGQPRPGSGRCTCPPPGPDRPPGRTSSTTPTEPLPHSPDEKPLTAREGTPVERPARPAGTACAKPEITDSIQISSSGNQHRRIQAPRPGLFHARKKTPPSRESCFKALPR
jgi:hypothetical protein